MRRLSRVLMVSWVVVAVGLTILIGPSLGWRGLLWLGVHHVLCLGGVWGELRLGFFETPKQS